jgi:tyrosine-protein kinase Etk/Wzc
MNPQDARDPIPSANPAYLVAAPAPDGPSIDLFELFVRFVAEWKIGLLTAIVVFIAGAAYVFHIHPQFEATAVVLPKQTMAETNNLASFFGGRHPEDIYTGLLRSRSVTDDVIRELGLIKPGANVSWEDQRAALLGSMSVVSGGDGLLRITVRSPDAQMAMRIANAYLDGLHMQQQSMALQQSALNRQFFEQQLDQEKIALASAENDLEQTEKNSGIIEAQTQIQSGLGEIAGVRNQITARQVELAALLEGATEENAQVKTLRAQIAQLEAQERTLEASGAIAPGAPPAAGRMPEANLEYERKQRAVRFHEALLTGLSSQYQNARLVEASTVDAFQVVDYAIAPERRSFPPRRLYLLFCAGLALFLGVCSILFVLVKRKVQRDADYQRHMSEIKKIFGLAR